MKLILTDLFLNRASCGKVAAACSLPANSSKFNRLIKHILPMGQATTRHDLETMLSPLRGRGRGRRQNTPTFRQKNCGKSTESHLYNRLLYSFLCSHQWSPWTFKPIDGNMVSNLIVLVESKFHTRVIDDEIPR